MLTEFEIEYLKQQIKPYSIDEIKFIIKKPTSIIVSILWSDKLIDKEINIVDFLFTKLDNETIYSSTELGL